MRHAAGTVLVMDDEMLRLVQVVDQFEVSQTQLHRWVKAGHFGQHRAEPHGKREPARLFSVSVLERLGAKRRETRPTPLCATGTGEAQYLEERVAALTRCIEVLALQTAENGGLLREVVAAVRNLAVEPCPLDARVRCWLLRMLDRFAAWRRS
jgi:hypothetical protein